MNNRIITHGGITLDLESVKCFKVQTMVESGKSNILTIELKNCKSEYIFNPNTKSYELHGSTDSIEVSYTSYESACQYRDEWSKIWEDYLQNK